MSRDTGRWPEWGYSAPDDGSVRSLGAGKKASVGCKESELTFGRAKFPATGQITTYRALCGSQRVEIGNRRKVIGQGDRVEPMLIQTQVTNSLRRE